MCGIVGVAKASVPVDEGLLARMRDTMLHRGPDDAGLWRSADGTVGLGHRRLSIIDLSPGGHQPMADATGRLQIVFNGEIYNFRELREELETRGHAFRTASDTEVILEAYLEWGPACPEKLNGMFAFGLWDGAEKRLLLARDRAGEKPLFYRESAEGFVFGSELKALLVDPAAPRNVDPDALDFLLALGYVPGTRCILQGYRKLAPGHALLHDARTGESRTWPYWMLPDPEPGPARPVEDCLGELESLLLDSVRMRLIADVPVGIMLSGGIDSSLVTAMAARVSSTPVRTFNISFPGHSGFDEGPDARLVARHFGTEHVEAVAEPATVDLLPVLAAQYDEPIGDSSMVPTFLVSRLIRKGATVALSGDGGDELFGGYPHYTWLARGERVRQSLPAPVRSAAAAVAKLLPVGVRGRHHLMGLGGEMPHAIGHVNLYFDEGSRRRLLGDATAAALEARITPEAYRASLCPEGGSTLQMATAADFRSYMVDDILVKVDRASMLTSLEVRAPWLDHRVIELAFGRVPDELRSAGGALKILTRLLARRLLPEGLADKKKQGFSLPLSSWFRGGWGDFTREVLLSGDPGFLDRRFVSRLLRNQARGLENTQRLFLLTMVELWRRHYRVSL